MGKNHKHRDNEKKSQNNEHRIHDDVKAFAKMSLKKFRKDNKYRLEDASGKKEKKRIEKDIRKEYFMELEDLLPQTLKFALTSGHHKDNAEIMESIYGKLFDNDFIKFLTKELKDVKISNIEVYPALFTGFVSKLKKESPEKAELFTTEEAHELLSTILKKKIKKMVKKGIPEKQAFDYLSIVPNKNLLARGIYFYSGRLFAAMYEYAATEEVDFETVMKVIFKSDGDDDDYNDLSALDLFILLERKDKIANMNEGQKALFNAITTWALNDLEDHKTSEVEKIIRTYINRRMDDAKNGKDSNRRIYLSSLQETEYPKISKVVSALLENEEFKKYL